MHIDLLDLRDFTQTYCILYRDHPLSLPASAIQSQKSRAVETVDADPLGFKLLFVLYCIHVLLQPFILLIFVVEARMRKWFML